MERKEHRPRITFHGNKGELIRPQSEIKRLPQEELVPIIEKFINGDIIDFISDGQAGDDFLNEIGSTNGRLARAAYTLLWHPGKESEEAYAKLADDLKHFSPNAFLLQSPQVNEWTAKLIFGISIRPVIAAISQVDKNTNQKEAQGYHKTVGKQIDRLKKTFSRLGIRDLSSYIRFKDISLSFLPKQLQFFSGDPQELLQSTEKEMSAKGALSENDLLDEEVKRAWNRLRVGWGIKQVEEIVSLLPTLHTGLVVDSIVLALEGNLPEVPKKLKGPRVDINLDPEGIVALLKWKWVDLPSSQKTYLTKEYPNVAATFDKNLELPNFSVSKAHLPISAISLLELTKGKKKEKFEELVTDVHKLAREDKNAITPWLVTLLALKAENPDGAESIDKIIESWDDLPEQVRETLSSERSGKLWLTSDGRLRTTDAKTNLLSAFHVFTSSKIEETKEQEQPIKIEKFEEPQTERPRTVDVDEVVLLPFLGEIGKVTETQVKSLISLVFQKGQDQLDEDNLLNEFERLNTIWEEKDSIDRERLYHSKLNRFDKYLTQGKSFGIDAIYTKGEDVVFVLDKNVALGEFLDKNMQIGLQGKLDEGGQLLIEGMDNSFIGEKEHLFLNNLALHSASQPLLYGSGIPKKSDKEIIRETNEIASFWNRSLRGSLPKIDRNTDNPYIVISIEGSSEAVMVGERSR